MALGNSARRRLASWSSVLGALSLVAACSGSARDGAGHGSNGGGGAGGTAAGNGGSSLGGVSVDGGSAGSAGALGTAGSAPVAGSAGSSTAAGAGGGACTVEPVLTPSGATIDVTPPMTISGALTMAAAGDQIVLHAGTYTNEQISKISHASHVFIEAAAGETVTLPGAHFTSCDHVVIDGVHFSGTLELDGSSDFVLRNLTLVGSGQDAALQFQGQGAAGAVHDVQIEDSVIQGGGRTIFVLGSFAPSEQWNHDLNFFRNKITCGSHNCFQISGGRDLLLESNEITGTGTSGVLTAGATRVKIVRNRFIGMKSAAMQIATPGMEWDNYAGVENMVSSEIYIANNLVSGWDTGVLLDAATNVAIVYNTVIDGEGIHFDHRTPHDQSNQVILNGNADIRIWDDILPSISAASGEMPPSFESNNLVWKSGGGGANLITADPAFAPASDFALAPNSPAIDAALVNGETPLVDIDGYLRLGKPDIGARELGATPTACAN
jgi:CheY-specific phosphatase CheX